jgi:putative hemolysin
MLSGPVLDAIGVSAFLAVGGLFTLAHAALGSLRDTQLPALAQRGARGRCVVRLVADPERVALTVRICATLASLAAAALGAATMASDLVPPLESWGVPRPACLPLAVAAVTLLVGYVALVLAELVPRRLAVHRAQAYALLLARPLDRVAVAVAPLRWLLGRLNRPAPGEARPHRDHISPEELREILASHPSIGEDERRLIGEVFAVADCQLREVMVPRTEVDFIDAATPVPAAVAYALTRPHSRYPVVRGSHDDVVGFVNIRDLLEPTLAGPSGATVTVGDLVREVPLLPATNRVLPALAHLRQLRAHLAIVVDEYGGTAGIVTVEDLVEELVGEIRDEFDAMTGHTRRLPGGVLDVAGLLNLDDFAEETGLRLPEGPYETVAGFVVARLGHIPRVGDSVAEAGHRFEVAVMDSRRVARLRVSTLPVERPVGIPLVAVPDGHPADPDLPHAHDPGARPSYARPAADPPLELPADAPRPAPSHAGAGAPGQRGST